MERLFPNSEEEDYGPNTENSDQTLEELLQTTLAQEIEGDADTKKIIILEIVLALSDPRLFAFEVFFANRLFINLPNQNPRTTTQNPRILIDNRINELKETFYDNFRLLGIKEDEKSNYWDNLINNANEIINQLMSKFFGDNQKEA